MESNQFAFQGEHNRMNQTFQSHFFTQFLTDIRYHVFEYAWRCLKSPLTHAVDRGTCVCDYSIKSSEPKYTAREVFEWAVEAFRLLMFDPIEQSLNVRRDSDFMMTFRCLLNWDSLIPFRKSLRQYAES
jgi:hypothetical protein